MTDDDNKDDGSRRNGGRIATLQYIMLGPSSAGCTLPQRVRAYSPADTPQEGLDVPYVVKDHRSSAETQPPTRALCPIMLLCREIHLIRSSWYAESRGNQGEDGGRIQFIESLL